MSAFRNSWRPFITSTATRKENEEVVQNGLAVTPSLSLELTRQGLSISAMNTINSLKFNGDSDRDWSVPVEFQRGIDVMADGYQQQQSARGKIRKVVLEHQRTLAQQQEGAENG